MIPSPPKNTIDGSIRFAIKCFMMYIKEPWRDKFHENVRAQQTSSGTDNSLLVEGKMLVQYVVRPDQANVFGFKYSGLDSKYFKIIILVLKEHSLDKRKLLDSSGHWWKRLGQLGCSHTN